MTTTNHTTLRMSGALNIEHLTALKLHIGVNAHGWAIVEGEAGENALEQLSGALAGREQHILTLDESGAEKCLFAGVIREAELVRVGGYHRFHVELLSGTCLMDREVRSRSFQDVGRTYSQVAEQVCSEYGGGAAICTVGEDKTLERPVIQYRETDWEFLMRMASHCGGVLVPETHRGLPRLWFGFPDRSFTCQFPEDAYTSGISQRYYELGGSAAGYSKTDFFYYDVESPQLCDLGWYTVFKGEPFLIAEKSAILERGELIFTYRLGRPGLGWGKPLYNEKISGMTLLGEVLETSRETLKLKLDIDAGWDPGGPYPYTWRPETGNFMYCMPQVGTRVSLYCSNYDEKKAIAVNCVRTNGASCGRMSDPAKRSFVTEHGKEMNLYPEEMSLVGSAMDNIWGKILVSDDAGVSFYSPKPIYVTAKEDVVMETPAFHEQAVQGDLLTAVCNVESGTVHASVAQSNVYDLSSVATNAEGSNCVAYAPYGDAPEESSFDLSGLVFAAIGVLAAIVVVGALSLTGIGAFLVGGLVAGMVTGALCASKAASDAGLTGLDYWKVVGLGALTGGIKGLAAGAALALAPYAAEAFIATYFPIGLMVGGTYLTSAALTTIGTFGLSAISTIYAGLKANDVMALSGTNYVQALTGMSDETYNTINSGVTALGSFIITMGMANPRAWNDLKNNQNTIQTNTLGIAGIRSNGCRGTSSSVYGSGDIAEYQYNMIENPGPLADIKDRPAKNFYGGRYNMEILTEDRIYYRGGSSTKPLGQWFVAEPPGSIAQVRIDTAVKPQWISPITGELSGTSVVDTVYAIKIPQGTTVYTGPVGSQGGVYCGGYDIMQTFIETPWEIKGVEVISKTILK